jgi:hypothetical protein
MPYCKQNCIWFDVNNSWRFCKEKNMLVHSRMDSNEHEDLSNAKMP